MDDDRVMVNGRIRQRTWSGEAALQAVDMYKPLSLDMQQHYDTRFTEQFAGKTPSEIKTIIDKNRTWSIPEIKGLKVYLINWFQLSQLKAEDSLQMANHANLAARNLRTKEQEFRALISSMNEKLISQTVDHISFFMGTTEFNQRWQDMGESMLYDE